MRNELDLDKETNTIEEIVKCKRCGQYFPPNIFVVNKFTSKSNYCKFCRTQKQMKSQILKD